MAPREETVVGSAPEEAGATTGPLRPSEHTQPGESSSDVLPTDDLSLDLRVRLVGRTAELQQLKQLFLHTRDQSRLNFVTIVGETGSGKSRLALEFARSVRSAIPAARVLHGESGLAPAGYEAMVRLLARRFGIAETEGIEQARAKVTAGVAEVLPERFRMDVTHLLAQLMNCPFPDSPVVEPLAQVPGQLEVRTYIAVRRFLERDAQRGPLLLYFDGVERARPETANLIHYLADGLHSAPVMIVASARPTVYRRHQQWGQGDFSHHRIELGGLPREEAAQLFAALARAQDLPEGLVQVARERLRGSPRAICELTRLLLETGVLRPGTPSWSVDGARVDALAVPRTHEEILRSRLRHLPALERHVLERAATVSEVFWLDAVVALSRAAAVNAADPDGPTLEDIAAMGDSARYEVTEALAALCTRGLIYPANQSSIAGEVEYRFAYPPIWDLAYELVDRETRCHHHRLVAQWLELRPGGRDEPQQEQIGWHLQRAGDGQAAAARYRRAGDAARGRYFNDKAIRLYKRALGCIGGEDVAARIHIWHDLGSVYQLKGDFDKALDAFERMVRLSWVVASRPKAAVAFNKMGRVWRQKGNLVLALEYLQRGLEMFRQSDDQRGIATSLDDLGQVQYLLGRYDEALDSSATALEMRRKHGDKRSIAASLSNIGNIEKGRGLFDEAEACYREALTLRREVADRYGYVASLNNLGALSFERGELESAREQWEDALVEAERIGASPLQVILLNNLGEVACRLGKLADARQRLQRSMALATEIEDGRAYMEIVRNLALVELQEGNRDQARSLGEDCLARAQQAQLPEMVGKAFMVLGEVHAATLFDASTPVETENRAEDYFLRATGVFGELGNDAELGRALKRLGEYRVERGHAAAAREPLQQAAEIFERLGMPEARTIRDMLSGI